MDTESQAYSNDQLGKDANALIIELNKGLQSKNLGEQCEAIAQFSNVLEKYPFPMVINTIFLKITEVFKEGTNYLRLCILRTCGECSDHLTKMTIVEDVVRLVMNVMHSNDPAARALTLRFFGILSPVMQENMSVHHAIFTQLDSPYNVELDAAIWACHRFASTSKSFAASLCPKVCSMLDTLATDTEWKLKLIPLGKYMHHQATTLEEIRSCLVGLLTAYQTTEFVVTILHTLTVLAARSPIRTADHLDVLLDQVSRDRRPAVQTSLMKDLKLMARQVPHLWTREHVRALCRFYWESEDGGSQSEDATTAESGVACRSLLLEVFCQLGKSATASFLLSASSGGDADEEEWYEDDHSPSSCATAVIVSAQDPGLVSRGVQLACVLAALGGRVDRARYVAALVRVKFDSGWHLDDSTPLQDIRRAYCYLGHLICAYPDLVSLLDDMKLFNALRLDGGSRVLLLCEFLCSICSRISLAKFLWVPSPTQLLSRLLATSSKPVPDNCQPQVQGDATTVAQSPSQPQSPEPGSGETAGPSSPANSLVLISALIFQLARGRPLLPTDRVALLGCLGGQVRVSDKDPWVAYRVARLASRYAQHRIAACIYSSLLPLVASEKFVFWLRGLTELSQAEEILSGATCSTSADFPTRLVDELRLAADRLYRARSAFACVSSRELWFHGLYLRARCRLLACCYDLAVFAVHAVKPTASGPLNMSLLNDSRAAFQEVAVELSQLADRCLDADDQTLRHIVTLKALVQLFTQTMNQIVNTHSIEIVLGDLPDESPTGGTATWIAELADLTSKCLREIYAGTPTDQQQQQHADSTRACKVMEMLVGLVDNASRIPLCLPRFFFQRMQVTDIRLVLLPKSGVGGTMGTGATSASVAGAGGNSALSGGAGDAVAVSLHVGHMVQVMGVVQQRSPLPRPPRPVARVEVQVVCEPARSDDTISTNTLPIATSSSCSQHRRTVRVLKDYFHAQFLVSFPAVGLYRVRASARPLDTRGESWSTGIVPLETSLVRVERVPGSTGTSGASLVPPSAPASRQQQHLRSGSVSSVSSATVAGAGPTPLTSVR